MFQMKHKAPYLKSATGLGTDFILRIHYHGIIFSDRVRPICLPEVGQQFNGSDHCIASGWGQTQCKWNDLLIKTPVCFRTYD